MNQISILSPSDFVSMPWKTGLGHTVEILREDLPGDTGFAWRLSMADVTTDGAFSHFGGYDRTLEPVRLEFVIFSQKRRISHS